MEKWHNFYQIYFDIILISLICYYFSYIIAHHSFYVLAYPCLHLCVSCFLSNAMIIYFLYMEAVLGAEGDSSTRAGIKS